MTYYVAECSIRVTALLEYLDRHLLHLVHFHSVAQCILMIQLKVCSEIVYLPIYLILLPGSTAASNTFFINESRLCTSTYCCSFVILP